MATAWTRGAHFPTPPHFPGSLHKPPHTIPAPLYRNGVSLGVAFRNVRTMQVRAMKVLEMCSHRSCVKVPYSSSALNTCCQPLPPPPPIHLLPMQPHLAYFPTVSLSYAERCELNFGARPFVYPVAGYLPLQSPPPQPTLSHTSYLLGCLERLAQVASASSSSSASTPSSSGAATAESSEDDGGQAGSGDLSSALNAATAGLCSGTWGAEESQWGSDDDNNAAASAIASATAAASASSIMLPFPPDGGGGPGSIDRHSGLPGEHLLRPAATRRPLAWEDVALLAGAVCGRLIPLLLPPGREEGGGGGGSGGGEGSSGGVSGGGSGAFPLYAAEYMVQGPLMQSLLRLHRAAEPHDPAAARAAVRLIQVCARALLEGCKGYVSSHM